MALARGRPRPSARRRQRRGDGALDRRDGGRAWGRTAPPGGGVFGSSVGALRGAQRGHPRARSSTCPGTRSGWRASGSRLRRRRPCSRARWKTPQARALFGGVAAHAFSPLNRPMSSSVGMRADLRLSRVRLAGRPGRLALDHRRARLGAGASTAAGSRPARRVSSLAELPEADVVVFDLAPRAVAEIAGDRLPGRVARAYRRYRHGPGAFKLDLAVEGGVPWTNEACRRAGTVHAVGIVRRARRSGARRQPWADARAALRPRRPAVPRRPRALEGRPPPGLGLRPRAERLRRRRDRGDPGPDRALRSRASASGSSRPRCARPPTSPPTTPTTSAATSSPAPTPRCRSCSGPDSPSTPTARGIPGVYHLLGRHPAGRRRARDERLQRRAVGASPPRRSVENPSTP